MIPKSKIFIVEDDSTCARLLEIYLTESEYEVIGKFSTGEEAVTKAEEIMPDVIFMDIMLAGMINGIEAATRIIMNDPSVIIIFTSAYDDSEVVSKANKINPLAFINKPYGLEDIQTVMQMAENIFAIRCQTSVINEKEFDYEYT